MGISNTRIPQSTAALLALLCICTLPASAQDWPTWGHDPSRNMVGTASNLPASFTPPTFKDDGTIDLSAARGLKWIARLGSQTFGNPTVAAGKVFVGTNNEPGYDPKHAGDRGVLLCLNEATGKLVWQLIVPKLAAGDHLDYQSVGLCSSPAVDDDRVYVVTNRCEVLCLDINGLANGNDGPFQDEAQYFAGPDQPKIEPGPTDADIIWRYDMRDQLGIFAHQMTSSAPLVVGDRLYITTSNGRNWKEQHLPSPNAPSLICLDKKTGRLLGQERSGISQRVFMCTWSSPSLATIAGRPLIIFGADDGCCYAFDPVPTPDGALKEVWRCDCNPPEYRAKDGKPLKYKPNAPNGPSGVLATPVAVGDRVYVSIGRDPEQGDGPGCLTCIDATKTGDISATGRIWMSKEINRSLSTAAIADGLLFAADSAGFVYCLDAATGRLHWKHDLQDKIWGSPLVADGKVYIGSASRTLAVFAASKDKKVLGQTTLDGSILSSAIVANGVLYVATEKYLYAIGPAAK